MLNKPHPDLASKNDPGFGSDAGKRPHPDLNPAETSWIRPSNLVPYFNYRLLCLVFERFIFYLVRRTGRRSRWCSTVGTPASRTSTWSSSNLSSVGFLLGQFFWTHLHTLLLDITLVTMFWCGGKGIYICQPLAVKNIQIKLKSLIPLTYSPSSVYKDHTFFLGVFKDYYPNMLNYILVFEMPWVLNGKKYLKRSRKWVNRNFLKYHLDGRICSNFPCGEFLIVLKGIFFH